MAPRADRFCEGNTDEPLNVDSETSLLVTRNFPPLLGGMETVNRELLEVLATRGRATLCGPSGSSEHVPAGVACHESALRPTARFLAGAMVDALHLARRNRARLVFAGSGLTAPHALLAARAAGSRSAVYLHGLDLVAAHPLYRHAWLPCIRACDLAVVNSRNTQALAIAAGVRKERIHILHPGCNIAAISDTAAASFRDSHGLGDARLLLAVGRLTRRKGLAEFVCNSLPIIIETQPSTILVIVGGEPLDALHGQAGGEATRIMETANATGLAAHVRLLGRCDQATLDAAYVAADCHVFPIMDIPGDVEGFGMVALEAAAHGVQTVAFSVGGVADAVAPGVSGTLVPAGNYIGMARAVLDVLADGCNLESEEQCRRFATGMDWNAFRRNLNEILDQALEEARP
jgi:phosphatidylinositol alpha-1,6-mannosyltransferase